MRTTDCELTWEGPGSPSPSQAKFRVDTDDNDGNVEVERDLLDLDLNMGSSGDEAKLIVERLEALEFVFEARFGGLSTRNFFETRDLVDSVLGPASGLFLFFLGFFKSGGGVIPGDDSGDDNGEVDKDTEREGVGAELGNGSDLRLTRRVT